MRCNKCGGDNPDDRLVCALCGHKLQSGRGSGDEAGETGEAGRALARPTDAASDQEAGGAPRQTGGGASRPEIAPHAPQNEASRQASHLLDFQGWKSPLAGLGPYLEACLYAGVLAVAVAVCLWLGVLWPLYPLMVILGVVAWLRRL